MKSLQKLEGKFYRIGLHLVCVCMTAHFMFHFKGILRELI
jgi:hypothetical protein